MGQIRIGVIGGSGLYDMRGLEDVKAHKVNTPFGNPSDEIITGRIEGIGVAFLPRHAKGHKILPSELPSKANIYALKSLGVEWIISIGAVGSMKEEIKPRDFVIPDQIFDRTRARPATFFGDGIVAHVGFANPYCPVLSELLYTCARELGYGVHRGGIYLCIEGPQFSTKAESRIYRQWGVDIIGMTSLPEARLAREAEICYATVALVTDYDVWREAEEVTIEMVLDNLLVNAQHAKDLIRTVVSRIPEVRECECARALTNAIITQKDLIPEAKKKDLGLLIDKYLK